MTKTNAHIARYLRDLLKAVEDPFYRLPEYDIGILQDTIDSVEQEGYNVRTKHSNRRDTK